MQVDGDDGPRYWLHVGRRVDREKIAEGGSVLNMTPVGTHDETKPRIRFDLSLEGKQGSRRVAPSIYPEDVLSLKVAPDGPSPMTISSNMC